MRSKRSKGVILCGGKGTRLRPATLILNKHLIAIVATPMVLYPLYTLKALGVEDIMIVTGGEHVGMFAEFLGDGSQYGVNLTYRVQTEAGGIAQALLLAEDFVSNDNHVWVILGDNIFGKTGFPLATMHDDVEYNALVVLAKVEDNRRFGVPSFSPDWRINGIIEKPEHPPSEYAVTGLYRYPNNVFDVIRKQVPSARGEMEITDVNNSYIVGENIDHITLNSFWSDCGTPESLSRTTRWFLDNPEDSFVNPLDKDLAKV